VIKIIENFRYLIFVVGLAFLSCLIIRLWDVEFFSLRELEKDFLEILAARGNNCLVNSTMSVKPAVTLTYTFVRWLRLLMLRQKSFRFGFVAL
jgi:hypothetical protein